MDVGKTFELVRLVDRLESEAAVKTLQVRLRVEQNRHVCSHNAVICLKSFGKEHAAQVDVPVILAYDYTTQAAVAGRFQSFGENTHVCHKLTIGIACHDVGALLIAVVEVGIYAILFDDEDFGTQMQYVV